MVDRPVIKTQTIEDFMIQVARSASTLVQRDEVRKLNETIGSYKLADKNITFGGIEGTGKSSYSITGKEVIRNVVGAVVDRENYEKALGTKFAGIAHHITMTPELRKYLHLQGVNFDPQNVVSALIFSPESLQSKDNTVSTILHEFGHGASLSSGLADVEKNAASQSAYYRIQNLLRQDTVGLDEARMMHSEASSLLMKNALEEARAEGFSLTAQRKNMVKAGTPVEDIAKNLLDQQFSSYYNPGPFKHHFSYLQEDVRKVYEKMGDNIKNLESPLTGKTGLSVEEMLDDFSIYARTQAAGTFRGAMRALPGDLGMISEKQIERAQVALDKALVENKVPEHQASSLPGILKQSSDRAKAMNRSIDITDSSAGPMEGRVTSTRPILQLDSVSPNAIYDELTEGLSTKPVQKTASSRTPNMLKAVTQASEGVAKRNSRSMQVASAIATVMKKRLF